MATDEGWIGPRSARILSPFCEVEKRYGRVVGVILSVIEDSVEKKYPDEIGRTCCMFVDVVRQT